MKKILSGTVSALMIATSIPTVSFAADQQTRGNIGGYDYEMWNQNGQGQVSMNPGAGSFTCSWSNIENFLARMGKNFDSQKKTYKQIGEIVLTYDVEYTPRGNSYMCVYGWTRNPLMEYYIVEGWGDWRPPGNDGERKGTVTLNGNTYDIAKTMRYNQPSLDGNATFPQYWSIRQTSGSANNQTNYMKGTIDVSKHFDAWSKAGLDMSGTLYEVSLNIEGYRSNGSANVKSVTVSTDGSGAGAVQQGGGQQQGGFDMGGGQQQGGFDWSQFGGQQGGQQQAGGQQGGFDMGNFDWSQFGGQQGGQQQAGGQQGGFDMGNFDWSQFGGQQGGQQQAGGQQGGFDMGNFDWSQFGGQQGGQQAGGQPAGGQQTGGNTGNSTSDINSKVTKWGDANGDGSVDMGDVVAVMQALAAPNKYKLTEQGQLNADVFEAGSGLTANDALSIQKYLLGTISKLPESYAQGAASTNTNTNTQPANGGQQAGGQQQGGFDMGNFDWSQFGGQQGGQQAGGQQQGGFDMGNFDWSQFGGQQGGQQAGGQQQGGFDMGNFDWSQFGGQQGGGAVAGGQTFSVGNGRNQYKADNVDGYSYEIWLDNTGGSGSMTLGSGGAFSTEWSAQVSQGNFLARRGRNYDRTKKATDCGPIVMDYAADYSASSQGNSRLCVYGWMTDPLVEYYIIEDWVNWRPTANGQSKTVTIDGAEYEIFQLDHTGPTILGDTRTFKQYFSVRKQKRTSGTITVSDHFKAWANAGWNIGNLTEVALNVEGWESSGKANVTKLTIGSSGGQQTGGQQMGGAGQQAGGNGGQQQGGFDMGNFDWSQFGGQQGGFDFNQGGQQGGGQQTGGNGGAQVQANKKLCAISFDDGASAQSKSDPAYRIIDALIKNNMTATFFIVGDWIKTNDQIKYEYQNGMEVANHTQSHPHLGQLGAQQIRGEWENCNNKLKSIIGAEPSHLMRLPYLESNGTVQSALNDVPLISCAIDTEDWNNASKDQIVNKIKQAAQNGSLEGAIVLCHENYATTAAAMEEVLPWLAQNGYQNVNISDMAKAHGKTLAGGQVHTRA